MFKKWMILISLASSVIVHAGHDTGNGGDSHLSRYLLAQHIAEVTTKRVSPKKLRKIFSNEKLLEVVNKNINKWSLAISKIKFEAVDEMLYENGKEKAALNIENSDQVKISKAYFEKYNLSLEEVIVNVIHEAGHKLGIRKHKQLDEIGSILVNQVYKYSTQKSEWLKYLSLDKVIKSSLDNRLKKAATEYLLRGEGIYLAKVLYFFTRFNLKSSNFSQMFRYMGESLFNVNIKTYIINHTDSYSDFKTKVLKRFSKELALYSRSISEEKSLDLVKYGMAKLKIKELLYTENIYDFNLIAKELNKILRNKNVDMNNTVVSFMKYITEKFYIWL